MRHPPTFNLDRYAAGELSQDVEAEISEHILICERCKHYLDTIASDKEELLLRIPAATFAYRVEALASSGNNSTRQRQSQWWKAAATASAAVALCILIWMSLPKNEPARTRWMGGTPVVQIYVDRNGNTQTINELKPIARDRLRYRITLSPGKRAYAVLVGVEGNEVLPLLPNRTDSAPFPVLGETFLPGSVEIEPGNEASILLLIIREQRFVVGDVLNEVKKAAEGASLDKIDVVGVVNRLQISPSLP